jgi:hypothetical protein
MAALAAMLLLAACNGGMELGGGPAPDSAEGQMLAPNPADAGQIDDTSGTPIPAS